MSTDHETYEGASGAMASHDRFKDQEVRAGRAVMAVSQWSARADLCMGARNERSAGERALHAWSFLRKVQEWRIPTHAGADGLNETRAVHVVVSLVPKDGLSTCYHNTTALHTDLLFLSTH